MGLNLLIEGAPLRRPRPPHRQTVISNLPVTTESPSVQSSSEEAEPAHKPFGQTPSAISAVCSGKEKRRQLASATTKRERQGQAEGHHTSYVRNSRPSLASEQALVGQTEPQRKTQCLGLGANGATLVPRRLSLSLSFPHRMPDCKSQRRSDHGSHVSRSFLPQTAFVPRHKTSTQVFPSLKAPLPTLKVFSLQPDIVARTASCHNPNALTHTCFHRHQFFLCARRQSRVRFKGEYKKEHKL